MTMFFGFMGLLIFAFMGPLLLILWCVRSAVGVHLGWAVRAVPCYTRGATLTCLCGLLASAVCSHRRRSPTYPSPCCPPIRFRSARLAGVGLGAMSWRMFGLMVAKGLLDNVLSDYLWARAILLLGETPWAAQGSAEDPFRSTLSLRRCLHGLVSCR